MKHYCNKDCANLECEFNLNHLGTNETALYEEMECGERVEVTDGQSTT